MAKKNPHTGLGESVVLRFRINKSDALDFRAAAAAKGLTLSAWIRSELLERVRSMKGNKVI